MHRGRNLGNCSPHFRVRGYGSSVPSTRRSLTGAEVTGSVLRHTSVCVPSPPREILSMATAASAQVIPSAEDCTVVVSSSAANHRLNTIAR